MRPIALFLPLCLIFLTTNSLAQDSFSITDFVADSGEGFDENPFDYDMLLAAVTAADLGDALADPSTAGTLFAPNDLAFVRLAQDLGYEGFDEEGGFNFIVVALTDLSGGDPIPLLIDILLYHFSSDRLDIIDVLLASIFKEPVETLLGETFQPSFFQLIDKAPSLDNPRLFFPINVNTDTGIVHTIDRVLIPLPL